MNLWQTKGRRKRHFSCGLILFLCPACLLQSHTFYQPSCAIPHIVTLFLYADSYIYIFPNRRLAGCIQYRLKIVSEVFCQLIFRKALSRKSRYCPIFSSAILVALSTVFKLLWNCRKLTVFFSPSSFPARAVLKVGLSYPLLEQCRPTRLLCAQH